MSSTHEQLMMYLVIAYFSVLYMLFFYLRLLVNKGF